MTNTLVSQPLPTVPAPLAADLLAEIAARIAAEAPVDRLPAGTDRRWTLLQVTSTYEAWIVAWPSGSRLPLHNHGGAAGAVAVLRGCLDERYVRRGRPFDRRLDATRTVVLPADHVHEVANTATAEAISVHVYSPPGSDPEFVNITAPATS